MDWGEYKSMGIGVSDRGGGLRKRIAYPHIKTYTTHGSPPLSLQERQWRDKLPPITAGQGTGSYLQEPFRLADGEDPRQGDFSLRARPGLEEALLLLPPASVPLPLPRKPEEEEEAVEPQLEEAVRPEPLALPQNTGRVNALAIDNCVSR